MSILNVVMTRDRAYVAVDTEAVHSTEGRRECSKLVPLVHLQAVIAMRGHQRFLSNVYTGCAEFTSLDAIVSNMVKVLQFCYDRHQPRSDLESPGEFMGEQVIVAGWSPERQSMVAFDYHLDEGGGFYLRKEITTTMLAPGDPFQGQPEPQTDSLGDLLSVARQQTRHARAIDPNAPLGGRLIVAELTRGAILIRPLGDLNG